VRIAPLFVVVSPFIIGIAMNSLTQCSWQPDAMQPDAMNSLSQITWCYNLTIWCMEWVFKLLAKGGGRSWRAVDVIKFVAGILCWGYIWYLWLTHRGDRHKVVGNFGQKAIMTVGGDLLVLFFDQQDLTLIGIVALVALNCGFVSKAYPVKTDGMGKQFPLGYGETRKYETDSIYEDFSKPFAQLVMIFATQVIFTWSMLMGILNQVDEPYLPFFGVGYMVQMSSYLNRGDDSSLGRPWRIEVWETMLAFHGTLEFQLDGKWRRISRHEIMARHWMGFFINTFCRDIVNFLTPLVLMYEKEAWAVVQNALALAYVTQLDDCKGVFLTYRRTCAEPDVNPVADKAPPQTRLRRISRSMMSSTMELKLTNDELASWSVAERGMYKNTVLSTLKATALELGFTDAELEVADESDDPAAAVVDSIMTIRTVCEAEYTEKAFRRFLEQESLRTLKRCAKRLDMHLVTGIVDDQEDPKTFLIDKIISVRAASSPSNTNVSAMDAADATSSADSEAPQADERSGNTTLPAETTVAFETPDKNGVRRRRLAQTTEVCSDEADRLFKDIDKDSNGRISRGEFQEYVHGQHADDPEAIARDFVLADDPDGHWSAINRFADSFFEFADENRDDNISREEFRSAYIKYRR